ncbi:MAG: hypothetical protein M1816_005293 [Peltula sp. TS41687]|nr:MAG: hypothetical protein M1816_005293 [Peltula sp. TS41687]
MSDIFMMTIEQGFPIIGPLLPKKLPRNNGQALLVRAGFVSPAHSGIFHMLPLGLRVQEKLESLIDSHMRMLNASKLALSSFSSETLWSRSGRIQHGSADLFRVQGRKKDSTKYILSPTHEEEITALVATHVQSYKQLPLRLYQTTRKYRNEPRPRQGLLRTREFVMNDLYTFDSTPDLAMQTYQQVRDIYSRFFDMFRLPYMVAEASSGDMGGSISHEYHFLSEAGEDEIVSCNDCDYAANMELAEAALDIPGSSEKIDLSADFKEWAGKISIWTGVADNGFSLVNVFFETVAPEKGKTSAHKEVNVHAVKTIVPSLDASREDPVAHWVSKMHQYYDAEKVSDESDFRIINLYDHRLLAKLSTEKLPSSIDALLSRKIPSNIIAQAQTSHLQVHRKDGRALNLLQIQTGDRCARCSTGTLKVQKAVELGHTFFLGSRYSKPLRASVSLGTTPSPKESGVDQVPPEKEPSGGSRVPMQMGCHGIGVSRMIGVVANTLADEMGLNWPRVMAPFEVVIIAKQGYDEDALQVYDALSTVNSASPTVQQNINSQNTSSRLDVVLDDRQEEFIPKLCVADLIGVPVIVVLGRAWESSRKCEVLCRRLAKLRVEVSLEELPSYVNSILERL